MLGEIIGGGVASSEGVDGRLNDVFSATENVNNGDEDILS